MAELIKRFELAPGNDCVDQKLLRELVQEQYDDCMNPNEVAAKLLKALKDSERLSPAGSECKDCITVLQLTKFLKHRNEDLEYLFHTMDTNNDQSLDLDDILEFLQNAGIDYDPEKLFTLYHALDRDGDGRISLTDFRRQLILAPSLDLYTSDFLNHAYDFFVDDLEFSLDSDVLLSGESSHGFGYFWAGGLAGVISRTCTAPFDRIKVFLIARSASRPQGISILEAMRTIYGSRGLFGFFVGNGLNVIKVFPESAMKFGAFEAAKNAFAALEGVKDPGNISRLSTFIAGGIGGMMSQLCVYPIDTLKFRVQCESLVEGAPKGVRLIQQTVQNMMKDGGIHTFYRGIGVGVLGIFPFAALDLGIFSLMKHAYLKRNSSALGVEPNQIQLGNLMVLSMGALSGSLGASVVYPINLVRTRIQTQGTKAHPYRYKGFRDCVYQTYAREGWRGYFRGLGPNLAKVAPSVSISYLVYENTKRIMGLA